MAQAALKAASDSRQPRASNAGVQCRRQQGASGSRLGGGVGALVVDVPNGRRPATQISKPPHLDVT